MPILIEGAEFTDFNGATLTYYQSNAGDKVTAVINVRSAIRLSSVNNPITIDYTLNTVFSPTVSWLDEGFRVGHPVYVARYNSTGFLINSFYTNVNQVDDYNCDFDTLSGLTLNSGDVVIFLVVAVSGNSAARSRDTLDLLINHSVNNSTGAPESLIDGEVTRAVFNGVGAMVPTDVIAGNLVGNQSGQFLYSAEIERLATPADGWLRHKITLVFANSGAFDPSWFASSNCLKLYLKLLWASVSSEPFARTVCVYNFDSNTGWFDQAHNTSVANSFIVSSTIDEISYCAPTGGMSVTVNGPTTDLGIGLMYIPSDASYYKNKPQSQKNLSMLMDTKPLALGIYSSETNPLGVACGVNITNISTVGSETTIVFDFGGTPQFYDFMTNRNEDDRLLYIWIKCGNTNLLVFNDQLTCEPVVTAPLVMEQDYGYLDHSQNVTSVIGSSAGFIADTEDDVAYLGTFLLEKGETFDSFSVKIEAYNDIMEADFTLQQSVFNFNGVQISADGRYLLNEQVSAISTLPNTSEKLLTQLVLEPSLDTLTEYGVKIYAPWLLNWKYWIPKTGVNVAFYPDQNENWEQYDDIADWNIRTELTLQKGVLGYKHANNIKVRPYDAEPFIFSEIEMIRELDSSVVTVIPDGELMRIRATHSKLGGVWSPSATWGMITVEPFESDRRWICSSAVPFDNNSFNPLTPDSGLVISISFPSPDVAVLECLFDSSKIDLSNGVSVTAKIKDPRNGTDPDLPEQYQERIKKTYPSVKIPRSFQEQDRGFFKCCDKVKVLGSPQPETWKKDVTSAWIKLAQPSDSFTFELRKNGVTTTSYTPTPIAFVNEPNAYYTTIHWSDVLALEGEGCYQIVIVWNIGGITGETVWRNTTYELVEYSIDEALGTARIRSFFNLNQMIEGINFTDSNVEDSIRFCGQIRKDQPNTKTRNVTYNSRRIEPVISEKYQTWIIETDGYTDPMLSLLEDLFLLSSNQLFISDYNAHTNSYAILDTEVTMTEESTPERELVDRFARQEVLTCTVGNRFRNERTYY